MKTIRDDQTQTSSPAQSSNRTTINKNLLPSRGRYYDSDLVARRLSAIEVKDLSKVTVQNVNPTFNRIIESAISGVDPDTIKINDKLWLIYFLRSFTYDDVPFKVLGGCAKCGTISRFEYRLKDLDVTYADQELEKEFKLINGDTVTVEFPTIGDEKEIASIKADPNYIENIDTDVMTVASHVKTINGESVSIYEAYTYFARGKGSAKDYSRLLTHLKKFAFGARPKAKFKCPKCKEDILADVPLGSDFFLPEI